MASTELKTVDAYIKTFPPEVREVLQVVRATIRKAVPQAEEGISYQMPVFKLGGRTFLYLGGFKQHFSLFPASEALVAAHPEVAGRVVSKGTIRFPLDERVPVGLIRKIAKFKARELLEEQAAKQRAKGAKKAVRSSKAAKETTAGGPTRQR